MSEFNKRSLFLILPVVIATAFCAQSVSLAKKPKAPPGPQKQIYEASPRIVHSDILNADGVAAYVVSASGTNRGFLLKGVPGGLANDIGMTEGDVVFSFDSHVVQDGNDVDRVLSGIPSGTVKVMFVHPGDAGLQLYNGSFRYTNRGGTAVAFGSGARGEKAGKAPGSGKTPEALPSAESYVLELLNNDRQKNGGLRPLHANATLSALARAHALDMLNRHFFNHVNPDGKSPSDRAAAAGIGVGVNENIAYQESDDARARQAALCEMNFMNEPPNQMNHRGNILAPARAAAGVGVACLGRRLVVVQELADKDP